MKMLVTYGSTRGGTAGLARMLGDALREEGFAVDVRPAGSVQRLDGYDAVVVGGALYAARWHPEARRFVRHHIAALLVRPAWFFSSGPLDASAAEKDIAPVRGLRPLMEQACARGHVTLGGRLAPDARGFVAGKMARKWAGDWRDDEQVRRFAHTIAGELRAEAAAKAS